MERDNLARVSASTLTPFAISSLEAYSSGLWLYPADSIGQEGSEICSVEVKEIKCIYVLSFSNSEISRHSQNSDTEDHNHRDKVNN